MFSRSGTTSSIPTESDTDRTEKIDQLLALLNNATNINPSPSWIEEIGELITRYKNNPNLTRIPLEDTEINRFITILQTMDKNIDDELERLKKSYPGKVTILNALHKNLYQLQINTFMDIKKIKEWPKILELLVTKLETLNQIHDQRLARKEPLPLSPSLSSFSNKYLKYKNKYLEYKDYINNKVL
jgi:hypothetical protein